MAIISIFSAIFLTIYTLFKTMDNLHHELNSLMSINFQFYNNLELNKFIVERFVLSLLSQPVLVITILFIVLIGLYLIYARRKMNFKESLKISYPVFLVFWSILYTTWWLVSLVYIAFNKKVVWREHAKE